MHCPNGSSRGLLFKGRPPSPGNKPPLEACSSKIQGRVVTFCRFSLGRLGGGNECRAGRSIHSCRSLSGSNLLQKGAESKLDALVGRKVSSCFLDEGRTLCGNCQSYTSRPHFSCVAGIQAPCRGFINQPTSILGIKETFARPILGGAERQFPGLFSRFGVLLHPIRHLPGQCDFRRQALLGVHAQGQPVTAQNARREH